MASARSRLAALPPVQRLAVTGAAVAALLGGLVGLVLGLYAYPATAWFAVLEVGVPAAIVGAALGAVVGVLRLLARRLREH
jgi:ABC-type uncharacterized transport system permease subunit